MVHTKTVLTLVQRCGDETLSFLLLALALAVAVPFFFLCLTCFPGEMAEPSQKKQKQADESMGSEAAVRNDDVSNADFFNLLPEEVITDHIFKLLGSGHFIYVALTNKSMHRLYSGFLQSESASKCETTGSNTFNSRSRIHFYIQARRIPQQDRRLCTYIVKHGNLEDLKHFHKEQGFLLIRASHDHPICGMAACRGDLNMLKWLRANGCLWDRFTCTSAASNGHFEILKWARANGCPWDSWTCAEAAENGHFEILKWARANGCP